MSKKYKESYLFNLKDTVVPSNFKNEKLELKSSFEVAKSSDVVSIDKNFTDSNIISVISSSRKYKLELRPNSTGDSPKYNITITDYENQKYISVSDTNANTFNRFVTTRFSGTVGNLNLQNASIKIYPLIGKNSKDEYLIYIIKTALNNKGTDSNIVPYTVNVGSL